MTSGILPVDRSAGFNDLLRDGRVEQPMTRANCWTHGLREFFKLVDIKHYMKRNNGTVPLISPLVAEALAIIDRLFAIDRDINPRPAAERLAVRQKLFAPIVAELETWMHATRVSSRATKPLPRRSTTSSTIGRRLHRLPR